MASGEARILDVSLSAVIFCHGTHITDYVILLGLQKYNNLFHLNIKICMLENAFTVKLLFIEYNIEI